MTKAKLIPRGSANYKFIRNNNYYYVDKTPYISKIEEKSPIILMVRPRRFGKSLFVNTLSSYYDINEKDNFNTLFGDLYVGKNPTKFKNSYLILHLNFSEVQSTNIETIETSFNSYVENKLVDFTHIYSQYFTSQNIAEIKKISGFGAKLSFIERVLNIKSKQRVSDEISNCKIYLIIDEYDNFSNNILATYGQKSYINIVKGIGFYREFMKIIKSKTESVIERIFMTGVSPVTMNDLSSGFSLATNISGSKEFNGMIGFNENEVREMLDYYNNYKKFPKSTDEIVEIMKPWYDNYCFSKKSINDASMFNSDMVLYFLQEYVATNEVPENMITDTIRTDYNKIRQLISIDKQMQGNSSIIKEIIANGSINENIVSDFPIEEINKKNNFVSLLYYLGMLSISGVKRGKTDLSIPNEVVKEQIYSYMMNIYQESLEINLDTHKLKNLMEKLAWEANWKDYFSYIANELREKSVIREFIEGEAHVKAFILAHLGFNPYYLIMPEYEMNKGFSDFYMKPDFVRIPDLPYSYVIEIKYCTKQNKEKTCEDLFLEAKEQLNKYSKDAKIQNSIGNTKLIKLVLVFEAWDLKIMREI